MAAPEVYHPHSELEVTPQPVVLPKSYHEAAPGYSPGYYDAPMKPHEVKEQRICGLRKTTFFLALALLLVILAAGIGGGVGGTMAVNNAKNSNKAGNGTTTITVTATALSASTSNPSSTTTSSSSKTTSTGSASAITVPTTGTIALDCPSLDNTNLTIKLTTPSVFNVSCGQDFIAVNKVPIDIIAVVAYSLEDCARACASYNFNWKSTICKAVRFNGDLGEVSYNYGTCWLKNGTGMVTYGSKDTSAGAVLFQ